ncbi:YbaB/EbfC family nucleoid-associated protein [Amycolatopsis sp.]|jgi:DNA-binding protein YbaB|uniref:YbaB/EbfC family nucleoid-associated protein n=1 Tax=Amycolatopsis sp. TaxID=37632 RepID=UPI002E054B8E|nr:YbaB/EbfC family nucleoid-associated protein [Amycolatopsis sp.]
MDRSWCRPDELTLDYGKIRDDLLAVQGKLAAVEASAESGSGLISASVDGRGELLELRLDPRIYRDTDSAALAKAITATIREAVSQAHDQVFELTKHTLSPEKTREDTDLGFDRVLHGLDRQLEKSHWS